ncbi:NAD(P)H-hydrate dehydratase [Sphingomonas desiccabilis]|uniref:Bifunctional NAD(P)H-hydrate repair enzyme n=2 Tax=Sphingomonas desiccabilis TaxID=429134 RepID=A0A4Q2J2T0_9SPHN|nr:NAD(P)H-hydrate dehydratase [Sphingomonas desiccabilis]
MRAAEQRCFGAGVSQSELMERASLAVAREVARLGAGQPVLVLAGPGNNGGDAYGVARFLRDWGHDVAVASIGRPASGAAAENAAAWHDEVESLEQVSPRPVLVDGLFGTGMSRALDAPVAAQLARLVAAASVSVAIDLPSGIETDTGLDLGAPGGITATVALGALKPAHLLGAGLSKCGHVLLADIGVEAATEWRSIARPRLEAPGPQAHKYGRGLVVVVAGSMAGASRLAARAALHGGAGYVILAAPEPASGAPDAIVHRTIDGRDALAELLADPRIGAVVIGPGLGRDEAAMNRLEVAIGCERDLVIDGDALSLLGKTAAERLGTRKASTLLTPHSGEFARMFEAAGSKIEATLAAAKSSGATVIHKGADTVIASAGGKVVVASAAPSWLSTAGTGDVLAGLVAARHAAGGSADEAVWLHSRAARRAGPAFAADDLIAQIPAAMGECL